MLHQDHLQQLDQEYQQRMMHVNHRIYHHSNSNIFVPQTRPMNPNEIAEHARVVYQRAIQRNQLQHQNDLMKHFHESLSCAQQKDQSPSNVHSVDHCQTAIDHVQVPSVPNVSHIGRMKIYH
jgi:hypothetical protein